MGNVCQMCFQQKLQCKPIPRHQTCSPPQKMNNHICIYLVLVLTLVCLYEKQTSKQTIKLTHDTKIHFNRLFSWWQTDLNLISLDLDFNLRRCYSESLDSEKQSPYSHRRLKQLRLLYCTSSWCWPTLCLMWCRSSSVQKSRLWMSVWSLLRSSGAFSSESPFQRGFSWPQHHCGWLE